MNEITTPVISYLTNQINQLKGVQWVGHSATCHNSSRVHEILKDGDYIVVNKHKTLSERGSIRWE